MSNSPSTAVCRTALYLFLLAVASTQWKGCRFGGSHHSIQVPVVRHLADPSLYPNDLLLSSLGGYVTFFFAGLAPLVRLFGDVELLYFVLYVLFHLVALGGIYALSHLGFRHPPRGL